MKLVHFRVQNRDQWGVVEGDRVTEIDGSICDDFTLTNRRHQLTEINILPPANPSKLIGVGLNYVDHARETGHPVPEVPFIFLKAPSAIIGHEDAIVIPFPDHEVHYEAELTVIMKRRAKDVAPEEALQYVLGYTCGNDVSDRTIQRVDGAPPRGKSLDTFAPLGPFIVTDLDPWNLKIECLVNGKVCQSSNTSQFVFSVPVLVSFLSRMMTLLPGDAVMTGTPSGVGPIHPGDVVEVRIEGIGTLRNPVRLA
jgi:2-keto-4-pentenoate hydratase/2-oxohepta-3-ene-1,7-dioic acid hydratase in catechol pathway